MAHSLRGRLLWWLLLPLAVFVLIAAAMAYDAARRTADLVQDSTLVASARTIGEDIEWRNGLPVADVPPAALEIFESPSRDSVFYKVIDSDGRLLAGNPALDVAARHGAEPVAYDTTFDGTRLRAVAYDRQLYDEGQVDTVTVVVAKTTRSRNAMVATIWRPQLVRLALMLVLAVVLVYLGLTFELRPLMKLKDDVADRGPMELEPIRPERLQHELRPIVDAINQCIARLNTHTATQRRFIADAAHQLRTPIAVLDTQIQYAQQRGHDDRELASVLDSMQRSSRKMADVTDKLLLLAHAEATPSTLLTQRVDLAALVSSVLEETIVLAQRRDIDLGAELGERLDVAGSGSLLSALVTNLVDNAVRYTQPGGCVTVAARRDGDTVVLDVIDDGPGIPAEARPHVFKRFYRVSSDTEGSGLGLAIVSEIAQAHGGSATLAPGPGNRGVVVTVRLPAYD
ncbi:sensor histidine kinase [Burkholderia multivorans]|uniref:sensor histidine kinase n=1 Tax=Burkholderia multivorans TaxID=87883 RepID=UPI000CFEBFA1|nr:sensor histidine kinase [Burkholderia multivorans]MBR8244857.1 sensor histidine kinase [Burkholderia multivorans]MDN7947867.1 sensor histidine kinase [Burkholderia multivorans]MDR9178113.1 Swarming motility regulation sensor protein RssA [Burkholderia multivorans]MDR9181595.1 Swarming motility regulation sensor protein RssA [Burkholderia multivorans]MDR9187035.1 Swarming motility regulation sensor protein RssA [Burkholderia multivorans]